MIVVRANGCESNPSPMSAESNCFENPIQVDKGRSAQLNFNDKRSLERKGQFKTLSVGIILTVVSTCYELFNKQVVLVRPLNYFYSIFLPKWDDLPKKFFMKAYYRNSSVSPVERQLAPLDYTRNNGTTTFGSQQEIVHSPADDQFVQT